MNMISLITLTLCSFLFSAVAQADGGYYESPQQYQAPYPQGYNSYYPQGQQQQYTKGYQQPYYDQGYGQPHVQFEDVPTSRTYTYEEEYSYKETTTEYFQNNYRPQHTQHQPHPSICTFHQIGHDWAEVIIWERHSGYGKAIKRGHVQPLRGWYYHLLNTGQCHPY